MTSAKNPSTRDYSTTSSIKGKYEILDGGDKEVNDLEHDTERDQKIKNRNIFLDSIYSSIPSLPPKPEAVTTPVRPKLAPGIPHYSKPICFSALLVEKEMEKAQVRPRTATSPMRVVRDDKDSRDDKLAVSGKKRCESQPMLNSNVSLNWDTAREMNPITQESLPSMIESESSGAPSDKVSNSDHDNLSYINEKAGKIFDDEIGTPLERSNTVMYNPVENQASPSTSGNTLSSTDGANNTSEKTGILSEEKWLQIENSFLISQAPESFTPTVSSKYIPYCNSAIVGSSALRSSGPGSRGATVNPFFLENVDSGIAPGLAVINETILSGKKSEKMNNRDSALDLPLHSFILPKSYYKRRFYVLMMITGCFIIILFMLGLMQLRNHKSLPINLETAVRNLDAGEKQLLLDMLQGQFNTSNASHSGYDPSTSKTAGHVSKNDSLVNNYFPRGADIPGYNSVAGLPEKYRDDQEIVSLMSDNRLHSVFYGIDYAPRGVMAPTCGATLREVMLDLAVLSRLTTRIRTYGMQCNQASLIFQAIGELNLNMTLAMGIWIGENDRINTQQMNTMRNMLQIYPRRYFESLYIGNEVLFREEMPVNGLVRYINEAKNIVKESGREWANLPVGTSEIGSKMNKQIIDSSDHVGVNIHPFFGGGNVGMATKWTFDFIEEQVESLQAGKGNKKPITISEVGWPYGGGSYKAAVAGPRQFQQFLDSFVCEARRQNYGWYWFEGFDEPWKKVFHSPNSRIETQWGIFTPDRKIKEGITIPWCW
ncbi:glycoside hydrolase family 17 protein [Babjeviella inositovora NRRL Y-12698]|uniref:glucan endo-1,3-beta-D-glucosidase n=1 Tax=Babjeviella inositovora NRRL Y-12698 TaxID=984486 RepID=A0A1E3QHD2_9ASCO|nr:glycoside hydrolase family 17 protein [Babjeviella inositovora NRRL Y-12698]ODQ77040.1 glycoside hydrolase family 17 protein [Babjeviella inositovora NRRL Y-12698]